MKNIFKSEGNYKKKNLNLKRQTRFYNYKQMLTIRKIENCKLSQKVKIQKKSINFIKKKNKNIYNKQISFKMNLLSINKKQLK